MNKIRISHVSMILVMLCLSIFALAFPSPAYAISILSVSPNLAVNNVATTITIVGADFAAGAVVAVGGTSVSASFVDATTLTATIPSGFPAGTYAVQVTNPDLSTASLPAGLIVLTPTSTPPATDTPEPTSIGSSFGRPQIIVKSFKTNVDSVQYGQNFKLNVRLRNDGQYDATNLQLAFTSSDLMPVGNAGVIVLGNLQASTAVDSDQVMTAIAPIYGKYFTTVEMAILYYDDKGNPYTEIFTINIPVAGYASSYATATPTGLVRSQLVVTNYSTDLEALQPGAQFVLKMSVQNTGNSAAKGVTMIVGGGSTSATTGETPQPGGVSGGSGEFTNFAPVGTSNIQSLGDIGAGQGIVAAQNLIVNVSTNPGAYPVKLTFSYMDDKGNAINDEQVITLLVYALPKLDVGFYMSPVTLFAGQPGVLPLQVTNLGKRLTVLGNITVNASGAMLENSKMLIGPLESGGYFTMDTIVTPETPGTLELAITIEYTDDFNQSRIIEYPLKVDVLEVLQEAPMEPTSFEGNSMPPAQETFWQKAWRFILGLLGLDSSSPGGDSIREEFPEGELPQPVPGG
jgi:hypothetical protein